jgi:hypothetical protein
VAERSLTCWCSAKALAERPRDSMRIAFAASLLALTLVGCMPGPEPALIHEFFAASRLRDLTALRDLSTVVFEPATDGVVTGFELQSVTGTPASDGRVVAKEVLISASVRLPDGRTVPKAFVLSLRRDVPGSDQNRWRGWMITAISERPAASASTPRP